MIDVLHVLPRPESSARTTDLESIGPARSTPSRTGRERIETFQRKTGAVQFRGAPGEDAPANRLRYVAVAVLGSADQGAGSRCQEMRWVHFEGFRMSTHVLEAALVNHALELPGGEGLDAQVGGDPLRHGREVPLHLLEPYKQGGAPFPGPPPPAGHGPHHMFAEGLDRGFVHYEDFPVSWGQALLSTSLGRSLVSNVFLRDLIGSHELVNRKSAERIRNDFLEWLDAHDRRPFFAFLNLFDAHEPYLPPRPYDRMFGAPSPRERMWRFAGLVGGSGALRIRKWTNSEAEDRQDLDLYEGAIAYVDAQLGALFAELERRGVLDGTLVVITSDHGEQHGEHGLHNHDSSLYLPLLHVPLLFVHPRAVPEGRRISQPVTLRDLPATIMDLVGFGDAHPFPGTSLRHAWTSSPEPGSSSVILSTLEPGDVMRSWYPIATGPMRSLIEGRYHYIRSGDAEEELYDLEADPRELRNLVGVPEAQPVLTRMRTRLDSALAAAHPRPPPRARRPGSDVAEASR